MNSEVAKYLSEIGKKGGATTGKAKARPRSHYVSAAKKRWLNHRLKLRNTKGLASVPNYT
jgi:hypothetical protein